VSERVNASWIDPSAADHGIRDSVAVGAMERFSETVGSGKNWSKELYVELTNALKVAGAYVPPPPEGKELVTIVKNKYISVVKNYKRRDKTVVKTEDLETVSPDEVMGKLFDKWRQFKNATPLYQCE
jgi:hypothetical protein